MKKLTTLLLLLLLNTITLAGGKLTVYLEDNGVTESISWQCMDLTECAERIQNRLEDKDSCDPRVTKVILEKVHIPGLDDA